LVNRPKKDLKEDAIDLRRDRVLELTSQGYSQRQIANILQVGHSTVGNDVTFLRQKAKENIKSYVDEKLPEEYEKCLIGITSILREAWNTSQQTEDKREKIQALSLAKECYSMKLDLLTNATVVKDAIRFVSEHNNNIKNEKVAKIDNDSELLHNAAASADAVATTNKVF
jgi:predicted transcriptional regulator